MDGTRLTRPPPQRRASPAAADEPSRTVAVLGLTLVVVWWLLPVALGAPTRPWLAAVWIAPPLLALGVGLHALRAGRLERAAGALLAAVPIGLALAQAIVFPTLAAPPGPGWGWAVTAVALLAYGGAGARALALAGPVRRSERRPLEPGERAPQASGRTRAQGWLLGGATLGALALVVVPTATLEPDRFAAAWGEARPEAAVLLAAVSTALGVAVLAVFVGPGLRASRERPPSPVERRRRVARALTLGALGVLAWLAFARR